MKDKYSEMIKQIGLDDEKPQSGFAKPIDKKELYAFMAKASKNVYGEILKILRLK